VVERCDPSRARVPLELAPREYPVVPPIKHAGKTLHEHEGYRFALSERRGGRWPELGTSEDREWLGDSWGDLHAVGWHSRFRRAPTLDSQELGARAVNEVLAGDWLPPHLRLELRKQ